MGGGLRAQRVCAAGDLAVPVVFVFPSGAQHVGDLGQALACPLVADAAPCEVFYLGDEAARHGDGVDGGAVVVQDAGAAGAVVGEADPHAAGVGVALDAAFTVVVDGVAQPVVPLPALHLTRGALQCLDVDGGAAFALGDVQVALAAALVDDACAFDDLGIPAQGVEFEVQRCPGGVEPPAALAPAASYVHATAQHLDAQVGVALLVFAIDPLDAGLAATRYWGEAQGGVGDDRTYIRDALGEGGKGHQHQGRGERKCQQQPCAKTLWARVCAVY